MAEPDAVREVRDCYGRRYRVGEHPRDLIGRPRSWLLWLAWASMAAVSVMQYGYGAAVPALMQRNGWGLVEAFWVLAVWAVFQAGVGFPTAYLRERGRLDPRTVMVAGAALCLVGLVSLAHSSGVFAALFGYSVLGGTGAGLIYAVCTSTVAKWYPERMGARVSVVTGAFAYGSIPFILAVVLGADATNLAGFLDVTGVVLFGVVAVGGMFFRDPPAQWWPPHIDPQEWALSNTLNPGRVKNMPALRQYSPVQALRTRTLPAMYVLLVGAGAVSLFNLAFLVSFATGLSAAPAIVALAAVLLVGVSGAGRALVLGVSDRVGRSRTLGGVMLLQTLAQLGLATAASSGSAAMLVTAAALAGVGGGACYPLIASTARECFGEQSALEVHALVYSAKAFGGLFGVGLAALAVAGWGFAVAFLIAGGVSLGSAALARTLRRPGLPQIEPETRAATPLHLPAGAWQWTP